MANILGNINVSHGKKLWNEINFCQGLADFQRQGFVAKYSWDDVYDVIAYERSMGMESFISAMMAVNLVKVKLRRSYLVSGDVFVGNISDRLQDVYNDLYIMFVRRIPSWDMSRGVYLDKYLALDIDARVRKTADFSVYGTGTGTSGPGVAVSLSAMENEKSDTYRHKYSVSEKDNTQTQGAANENSLKVNTSGELFEHSEKLADHTTGAHAIARAITSKVTLPSSLQALAFTAKFKVKLPMQRYKAALHAMNDYIMKDTGKLI